MEGSTHYATKPPPPNNKHTQTVYLFCQPGRPPNPVNVVLGGTRKVKVDHEGNRLDVDSPRHQVSGNEQLGHASPELRQAGVPLPLLHQRVDTGGLEIEQLQSHRHQLTALPGGSEYDPLISFVFHEPRPQQVHEVRQVNVLREEEVLLLELQLVERRLLPLGDVEKVKLCPLERLAQRLYRLRDRRREEVRDPPFLCRGKTTDDFSQRLLERLVQQLVGLVKHEILDFGEHLCDIALLDVDLFSQSARRGDDHMRSRLELQRLLHDVNSPDAHADLDVHLHAEYGELVPDLEGEFPRPGEDEPEDPVGVLGQRHQNRPAEAYRLSRSRLRAADNVVTPQRRRKTQLLNLGRRRDAHARSELYQPLWHTQVLERLPHGPFIVNDECLLLLL
ncbi:uncharacterized protein BcabD6B2_00790 [Babesia caballi]|uniref:Uncharacterized protein n=1 Tax=Babesia caballi TaxID=5871 RepID=A0AAV4LP38_BABCB|nr:hypothetical protein BcabD6B2_00790 [Babesia caballi]